LFCSSSYLFNNENVNINTLYIINVKDSKNEKSNKRFNLILLNEKSFEKNILRKEKYVKIHKKDKTKDIGKIKTIILTTDFVSRLIFL